MEASLVLSQDRSVERFHEFWVYPKRHHKRIRRSTPSFHRVLVLSSGSRKFRRVVRLLPKPTEIASDISHWVARAGFNSSGEGSWGCVRTGGVPRSTKRTSFLFRYPYSTAAVRSELT